MSSGAFFACREIEQLALSKLARKVLVVGVASALPRSNATLPALALALALFLETELEGARPGGVGSGGVG